jgi:hypothetical protein
MHVKFHIGRLTIDGASCADGIRVSDALRSRLTELAGSGLPLRSSKIDRFDAGTLPPGASAEYTGRHLADRIFRNLRGSRNV